MSAVTAPTTPARLAVPLGNEHDFCLEVHVPWPSLLTPVDGYARRMPSRASLHTMPWPLASNIVESVLD